MFDKNIAKKIMQAFMSANGDPTAFFNSLDYVELEAGGFMTKYRYGKVSPMELMQHLVRQASLGKRKPIKIGSITLGAVTDVTDPCYDRGRGNDLHVNTAPGQYDVYIKYSDESFPDLSDWDYRICSIRVIKHEYAKSIRGGYGPSIEKEEYHIGSAPVDAGMCGFFDRKSNYDDVGWDHFCADLGNWSEWKFTKEQDGREGVCCSSGFGDGCYDVYGLAPNGDGRFSILDIVFIK